jgi:hypothetical protein
MRIWQVASGDSGRDFSALCVRHDLMLLGPGNPGEYDAGDYGRLVQAGELSAAKANSIGRFRHDMKSGDIVLLRKGHRVVAIGVVPDGEYVWDPTFDDVLGWDLQHRRRVIWQDQFAGELLHCQEQRPLFGDRKQIPMFTSVADDRVLGPLNHLLTAVASRDLRPLPDPPSVPLTDADLGRELFSRGLSNRATDDVIAALRRQRRLEEWYQQHGVRSGRPTEHEVIAHMVLPLLLALGWSEQLLAVEWHRIDLAGFRSAPTAPETCSIVCEAKGQGHGLSGVFAQALGYIERLKLAACDRILLTDGGRYYLYERRDGYWPDDPTAYLSASQPRVRYLDGTSAIDALMSLRQS